MLSEIMDLIFRKHAKRLAARRAEIHEQKCIVEQLKVEEEEESNRWKHKINRATKDLRTATADLDEQRAIVAEIFKEMTTGRK